MRLTKKSIASIWNISTRVGSDREGICFMSREVSDFNEYGFIDDYCLNEIVNCQERGNQGNGDD